MGYPLSLAFFMTYHTLFVQLELPFTEDIKTVAKKEFSCRSIVRVGSLLHPPDTLIEFVHSNSRLYDLSRCDSSFIAVSNEKTILQFVAGGGLCEALRPMFTLRIKGVSMCALLRSIMSTAKGVYALPQHTE